MFIVLGIFSAGLLGVIIYFAVSPKSSRLLRLTAIVALGLIALAIGVCSVILIKGPAEKTVEIPFPVFPDAPKEPPKKGNIIEVLVFLVIMLFIMGLIIVLVRRDHKRKGETDVKPQKSSVFQDDNNLDDMGLETESPIGNEDDESFDIGDLD
ncbi:MAG: hypothetical protein LBH42_08020 [Treponema sp.]|jgi:flagellar basal body-associated protein FliL|nr:hypothetical protein [Treponema sp.]